MNRGDHALVVLRLALQASAYDRLGPGMEGLARATRNDMAAELKKWPEGAVQALAEATARVEAAHHELDRGRNHFIKAFRAEHGADATAWGPGLKEAFDAGVAAFTRKKEDALTAAAGTLIPLLDAEVRA